MVLRLLIVSFWLVLNSQIVLAASEKKPTQPAVKAPEMSFQIMRASDAACEPNCPEWIEATGDITSRTASRFNQVVKLSGNAPLVLVIQSGGGDVRAALAMGRTIRARKMSVVVGRAYAYPCMQVDTFCGKDKKPKSVAKGWISSGAAYCASACTLVLAAGVQRVADRASMIGTHQILNEPRFEKVYYREKYLLIHGKKKIISRTITKRELVVGKKTTKLTAGFESELQNYVKDMGVDKSFLDFFAKAPPSSIYNMTASDRMATHIVTLNMSPDVYARPAICLGNVHASNCVAAK